MNSPLKKRKLKIRKIFYYKQLNAMDCGPTCLRIIAKYYGKNLNTNYLKDLIYLKKQGASLLDISEAAKSIGLKSLGVSIDFETLIDHTPLPAILHWKQNHYVVISPNSSKKKIIIADPSKGKLSYTKEEFCHYWFNANNDYTGKGIVLLLEPTQNFFNQKDQPNLRIGWNILIVYLKKYKKYFFQVFLSLVLGSMIQLIFPFLSQIIVDSGIAEKNLKFITIILIAQLMLLFTRTVVEFIRSRLLLHISSRVNISILSDFWIKIMRLPISFFDSQHTGDIIQRVNDHQRIEKFLTNSAISATFSIITFFVFSIVLFIYNSLIFLVFFLGGVAYILWIRFFLKIRRKLDYQRFEISSHETDITMQLVTGMQDIKLNNAEYLHRWEWENIQTKIFKLSFKSLSLSQYQETGAFFINEGKNILISFLVAKMVVDGYLTLGSMIAIQYIIGQLNSPIEQLIGFVQSAQDAKISMERLNEIHQMKDEELFGKIYIKTLPESKSIKIENLSFSYSKIENDPILTNLSFIIPENKTTAIVGMSGSGKTTLIKLLLKFYENYEGNISVGDQPLNSISPEFWRTQCGSVMQNGFIFSGTILKNIAVNEEFPDMNKIITASKVANILDFIYSLPLKFNTKIGIDGSNVSQGQKQRILIARAVYRDPHYIFLDEATNSLDSNNETQIMGNLTSFLKNKTVIIIAHRLSTVKNADNIIVLDKGEIVESGDHQKLISEKGHYYALVKNQLGLGLN